MGEDVDAILTSSGNVQNTKLESTLYLCTVLVLLTLGPDCLSLLFSYCHLELVIYENNKFFPCYFDQ